MARIIDSCARAPYVACAVLWAWSAIDVAFFGGHLTYAQEVIGSIFAFGVSAKWALDD